MGKPLLVWIAKWLPVMNGLMCRRGGWAPGSVRWTRSVGLIPLTLEEGQVSSHSMNFRQAFGRLLLHDKPCRHFMVERDARLRKLLADLAFRHGRCAQRVGLLAVVARRDKREAGRGQRRCRAGRGNRA